MVPLKHIVKPKYQKSEDKHDGQDKSSRNPKNKGKLGLKEKSQGDQKKKWFDLYV
ncbi:conserved hypothetical protein [Ricinus communis]|uniref:Uncharacterized protein n=1 Tax=Ricinus communis TaxID=3988 RepID=B9S4Q4_RICCO|nr:conserved hypothetical protein [Ricinus communis]